MMTRAIQIHQARHMQPAGRVFETPAIKDDQKVRLGAELHFLATAIKVMQKKGLKNILKNHF